MRTLVETRRQTVDVGDPFPDLTFPGLNGGQVRLSSFRGNRVFLFNWSSW